MQTQVRVEKSISTELKVEPIIIIVTLIDRESGKLYYPVVLFFIIFTDTTASPIAANALLMNVSSM